jgi:opacity protein-like surface antigen
MKRRLSMTIAALALAIAPSAAYADGYIVPFIGANFGGNVGKPLSETVDERNRMTWGFGVGGMAGGIFGAEFDFGYTHNFYASDGTVVTKSNLITAMPALVIGIPIGGQTGGGVRPYVLAGAGLLRRDLDFNTLDSISENDWGYTLGGGVMGYFSDHVGLRGDLRYFRNFKADILEATDIDFERGTFNFGRASIGVLFRF